ncbi:hypothetical protein [Bacillus sonorensis]|uniref:hypothetical protein n=1 Tax=Bacillus sonorensis TaxID=119858 RepID=UPI002DB8247D|nr:hypothetical protein [Bacillus sonorensis]MEC0341897.1 hypothetical protein [Bacillus sonorensis]MEC0457417.1 hypothetical protein [Bacillus sonorensis]MEC0530788.1 hypothetical protein [Bacillus sonorensis]
MANERGGRRGRGSYSAGNPTRGNARGSGQLARGVGGSRGVPRTPSSNPNFKSRKAPDNRAPIQKLLSWRDQPDFEEFHKGRGWIKYNPIAWLVYGFYLFAYNAIGVPNRGDNRVSRLFLGLKKFGTFMVFMLFVYMTSMLVVGLGTTAYKYATGTGEDPPTSLVSQYRDSFEKVYETEDESVPGHPIYIAGVKVPAGMGKDQYAAVAHEVIKEKLDEKKYSGFRIDFSPSAKLLKAGDVVSGYVIYGYGGQLDSLKDHKPGNYFGFKYNLENVKPSNYSPYVITDKDMDAYATLRLAQLQDSEDYSAASQKVKEDYQISDITQFQNKMEWGVATYKLENKDQEIKLLEEVKGKDVNQIKPVVKDDNFFGNSQAGKAKAKSEQ